MKSWTFLSLLVLAWCEADEPSVEPTYFGTAVDAAGDVDLDGYDDVILGAWWDGGTPPRGRVSVYSGATGKLLRDVRGAEPGAHFGLSVAGAGDVDADGAGDFVVGAPFSTVRGRRRGSARVYSGRTGELLHTLEGEQDGGRFGLAVASAGDANDDGFDDVAVGAPACGLDGTCVGRGVVRVYSGKNGKLLHELVGQADGDGFGWSVDGAGDTDGDGFDDLVVGAFGGEYVRVFSGRKGKLLRELRPTVAGGRYGWAAHGAGDVDQDGFADVVVGIPRGEVTGALVFSGKKDRDLLSVPRELSEGREGWSFGISVDGAGDVNADGFADLVVGDPGFPSTLLDVGGDPLAPLLGRLRRPASRPGRAYVYSGEDGELLFSLEGSEPDDWFGVRVRGAGDVDQDGLADVIVGAGRDGDVHARVYSGREGKLLHTLTIG